MPASTQKHSSRSVPAAREAAKEPGLPILSSDQSASEHASFQTRCALQAAPYFLGELILAGDLKASFSHTHFLPKESLGAYDQDEHQESEHNQIAKLRPNDARGNLFDHTNQDTSEKSSPKGPHPAKHNHDETAQQPLRARSGTKTIRQADEGSSDC